MSVTMKTFGVTAAGETVTQYTLTNETGAYVSILDLGGIVTNIVVPDRDGNLADVNLSFDDPNTYMNAEGGSMGMLIGRYGNRIADAAFDLDGKHYVLAKNDGVNNLHGGVMGFGKRMWQAEPAEIDGDPALILSLVSEDGEEGFPGKLEVQVTYAFSKTNGLLIHYEAVTDAPTIINMTNHVYLNLDGHDEGTIENLELQVFADGTTEVREGLIPTGRILDVKDVAWDFSQNRRMGDVLAKTETDPTMNAAGGVDFNYCAGRDRETKLIATLYSPKTGRVMDVITDQPGVQCYTGQGLDVEGKGGVHYGRFGGVCLETQHYADSIHHPHFPSVVLRPQDTYDTFTIYQFSVK